MKLQRLFPLLLVSTALLFSSSSFAQNRTLVIGDSGSEEYAVQVSFSAPTIAGSNNQARNWVELLATERPADFNFGSLRPAFNSSAWDDYRTWGYEYNFSFPGDTTQDGAGKLSATASSDFISWQATQAMNNALVNSVDRVVIFLGANDARDYYQDIYNGDLSALNTFSNQVIGNLTTIIDHIQGQNPNLPIVVVNIPDVGATPEQKDLSPDQGKREDYSVLLKTINDQIRDLTKQKGIAVADVYSVSRRLLSWNSSAYIGGLKLNVRGHPDNDPLYLFCRDNFHPNTAAQAFYARAIVRGLNATYNTGIVEISDQAIIDWLRLTDVTNYPYRKFIPLLGETTVTGPTSYQTALVGNISSSGLNSVGRWFYSDLWGSWMIVDDYEEAYYTLSHGWVWLVSFNGYKSVDSYWAYSERLRSVYVDVRAQNGWLYTETYGWLYPAGPDGPGIYYSLNNNAWVYIEFNGAVYDFALNQWLP